MRTTAAVLFSILLGGIVTLGDSVNAMALAAHNRARLRGLPPGMKMRDQAANAFRKLHNLPFSLQLELNLIIPGNGVIDGLFEYHQRPYHLPRQNQTYPETEEDCNR